MHSDYVCKFCSVPHSWLNPCRYQCPAPRISRAVELRWSGTRNQSALRTQRACHRLSHLLVRQELKPSEVLLGRIAAFLHTSSLLHPGQGKGIRYSKEHKSRTSGSAETHLLDGAGIFLGLPRKHVKCPFSLQFYPGFTGINQ